MYLCIRWYICNKRRVWRYQKGNQNPYKEEQTTQWPKEKSTKGQTTIYKTYNTHKTKDRVTRTLLKAGGFKVARNLGEEKLADPGYLYWPSFLDIKDQYIHQACKNGIFTVCFFFPTLVLHTINIYLYNNSDKYNSDNLAFQSCYLSVPETKLYIYIVYLSLPLLVNV